MMGDLSTDEKYIFKKGRLNFARMANALIFAIPNEHGSVVQLVRMPPCHGGGRGFESRPVRKAP